MGLLKSNDENKVLAAVQKLRVEVRDMADGWRNQQSVHNDEVLSKLNTLVERLDKLLSSWERFSKA